MLLFLLPLIFFAGAEAVIRLMRYLEGVTVTPADRIFN